MTSSPDVLPELMAGLFGRLRAEMDDGTLATSGCPTWG